MRPPAAHTTGTQLLPLCHHSAAKTFLPQNSPPQASSRAYGSMKSMCCAPVVTAPAGKWGGTEDTPPTHAPSALGMASSTAQPTTSFGPFYTGKKKKAKKRIVVTVGNKTRRISEEQDLAITPMCVNSLQLIHKRPRGSSTAVAPGAEQHLREDAAPGQIVDMHRKGTDFSCCWRQPPLPQLSMLPAPQLLFPERERPGSMEAPHCASSKETLFSVPTWLYFN